MKPAPQAPPIHRRPALVRGTLGSSTKSMGESSRHLYELQAKEANYYAMMHRFQLRRVSTASAPVSKFRAEGLVIDKESGSAKRRSRRSVRNSLARWVCMLTKWKTWRRLLQTLSSPILPGSWLGTLHGILMLAVYHFQLLYLPFAPCYYPAGSEPTSIVTLVLEFVFLADLLLNFNTAYKTPSGLVTSRRKIVQHCLTRWFLLDLLSAIPVRGFKYLSSGSLDRMAPWFVKYDTVLMALRLIRVKLVGEDILMRRVVRLGKHMATWFRYSRYSHLLNIAQLMWLVLLIAHYMACIWHVVAENNTPTSMKDDMAEQYVSDYYRAMTLIQGEGNMVGTWQENLLSTVTILLGSVILAIVFGNVAMLVSNFNASSTNYHRKMEAVYATMDKMKLPEKLQERIHEYYSHVWSEYESLDGDVVNFQRELTHTLGLEVGLYNYMNLVNEVPFWTDCSPDFATQIILNLAVRVYLPDDYIVRKEETGDEMFMINRGVCVLVDVEKKRGEDGEDDEDDEDQDASEDADDSDSKNDVLKHVFFERKGSGSKFTLEPDIYQHLHSDQSSPVHPHPHHQYRTPASLKAIANSSQKSSTENQVPRLLFPGQTSGELSLLMNYKQPLNIRAVTYVEMCILDRATFQRIISRYPEDRRTVLMHMLRDCMEKGEFPFSWEELCDVVCRHREWNGESKATFADVDATLTSTEAANALVERLDVDIPDETIRFGLQGSNKSLDQQLPPLGHPSMNSNDDGHYHCLCCCEGGGQRTSDLGSSPTVPAVKMDRTPPKSAQTEPSVSSSSAVAPTTSPNLSPSTTENNGSNRDELMEMMRVMTSAVIRIENELKSVKERLDQVHPTAQPLPPQEDTSSALASELEEADASPVTLRGDIAATEPAPPSLPTRPRFQRVSSAISLGQSANLPREGLLRGDPPLQRKHLTPMRFKPRQNLNPLRSNRTACEMQVPTAESHGTYGSSSGADTAGQNTAPMVQPDQPPFEVASASRRPQLRRLLSSTFMRITTPSLSLDDLTRESPSSSDRETEMSLADQLWSRQVGVSSPKQSTKPAISPDVGGNRRRSMHEAGPNETALAPPRKLSRLHSLPSELDTLVEAGHAIDFTSKHAQSLDPSWGLRGS